MLIFKIIGVALVACVAVVVLKQTKPEFAMLVGVVSGLVIIFLCIDSLTNIVACFRSLVEKSGLSISLFSTVLKIVGIGYLVEFAANICNDAGSSSLADKLLLAGKVTIMALSMPILLNIVEILMEILP